MLPGGRRSIAAAVIAVVLFAGSGAAEAAIDAHGSARQVYATGLAPRAPMQLLNRRGKTIAKKRADALGGVLFRGLGPGSGYRVRAGRHGQKSARLRVLSTRPAPPSTAIYNQSIPPSGYGYLTTRDGTKLAINVHPPQDVSSALPTGPLPPLPSERPAATPTLIEYSGYGYADPAGPQRGIAAIANVM